RPALAVWNDNASKDTTRARQVIFFIVDVIFRLLGMVEVNTRRWQHPPWRRVNIRVWALLVCSPSVAADGRSQIPTKKRVGRAPETPRDNTPMQQTSAEFSTGAAYVRGEYVPISK